MPPSRWPQNTCRKTERSPSRTPFLGGSWHCWISWRLGPPSWNAKHLVCCFQAKSFLIFLNVVLLGFCVWRSKHEGYSIQEHRHHRPGGADAAADSGESRGTQQGFRGCGGLGGCHSGPPKWGDQEVGQFSWGKLLLLLVFKLGSAQTFKFWRLVLGWQVKDVWNQMWCSFESHL